MERLEEGFERRMKSCKNKEVVENIKGISKNHDRPEGICLARTHRGELRREMWVIFENPRVYEMLACL